MNANGRVLAQLDARDQLQWMDFNEARVQSNLRFDSMAQAQEVAAVNNGFAAQLVGPNVFLYDDTGCAVRVPLYNISGEKPLEVEIVQRLTPNPRRLSRMLEAAYCLREAA